MSQDNGSDKKRLIEEVKKLKSLGLDRTGLVPISEPTDKGIKKPPAWFDWTDYRDGKKPALTESDIEEIWGKPEVVRAAIMLDYTSFLIDIEGEGMAMQRIIAQRMSYALQKALNQTRTTLTPHGYHILVHLDSKAFPNGIPEMLCWRIDTQIGNKGKQRRPGEHAAGSGEIRVLSQSKYAIEAGEGYWPLDEMHEIPVQLDGQLSKELVDIYRLLTNESMAIRNMVNGSKKESILEYYSSESGLRHDIALGLAGALANASIPENIAYDLVYYIAKVTNDDELEDRLRAVSDTYENKRKGETVAGYSKLIAALDGNDNIITKIREGFLSLGYKFIKTNVKIERSETEKRFFGSVDDIEGSQDPSEGIGRSMGSKADEIIQVCTPFIKDLFVDKFDVTFASLEINGRLETIGIRRHKFKLWIRKTYYDRTNVVVPQNAMDAALGLFESQAMYSDRKKLLALRISDGSIDISSQTAEGAATDQIVNIQPTRIYYDLANKSHQVIEIKPDGWTLLESSQVPQMFYQLQGQQPQVIPVRDYPENIFDQFMDLMNTTVKDSNGTELPKETQKMRMLLKCYIVALFVPNIGRVILLLYGEQGSAKTAFMELVKMLVDPSGALTLAFPRSMAEIVQQLSHNFIAYYDNVSVIKDWLSDVLCRASTGTGFTKRQLYTDDDDIIYEFVRSVGISAIHLPGSKPDMLDRSLLARFSYINKDFRRKYKEDILPTFYKIRAQVLGYIFNILKEALKMKSEGGIELETRSRMADWEEWCEIIARCMGYKPMEFINAYVENTKLQSDLILEDRPVARAIVKLVGELEGVTEYAGQNTSLLNKLEGIAMELDINTKAEKLWPKSANALSYRINEIKPTLRELGIEVYDTQDSRTRVKTVHICTSEVRKKLQKQQKTLDIDKEIEARKTSLASLASSDTMLQKNVSSDANDANDDLQRSSHKSELDYFDLDSVQIVNVHKTLAFGGCDVYIGRNWKEGYGLAPLAGIDGRFGNPFVMNENGGHDGTREEVLAKYEEWLWHGTEVVNEYNPKEYRRRAIEELPYFKKWGCHCAPEPCHGDILLYYVKRQLQIKKAHKKAYEKKRQAAKVKKGGDSK